MRARSATSNQYLIFLSRNYDALSAGHANDYGRNIFRIYERIEKFRARQIRKVHDIVGHLRDFAPKLFSRSQMQLDSFADVAPKNTKDCGVRLQSGFFLADQT